MRRDDIRKTGGKLRFSPRPRSIRAVRQFSVEGGLDYITDGRGRLETRSLVVKFTRLFRF